MAIARDPARELRAFWSEARLPEARWPYYAFQARRYEAIVRFLSAWGPWGARRLLDLGGGVGSLAVVLRARLGGRYDLAEFEAPTPEHRAALARYGVEGAFAVDLTRPDVLTPLPNGYDAILLVEVLEHLLVNPLLLFRQVWEHLAPGGLFFLTTPNQARLRNRLRMLLGRSIKEDGRYPWGGAPVYGHVIEFTVGELERLLRAESFAPLASDVVQQVPSTAPSALQRFGVRLLNTGPARRARLGDDILLAVRKIPRPSDGSCPVALDPAGRL